MSNIEDKHGIVVCETSWGKWYQTAEEVYVDVNAPAGTKGRDVQCDFKNQKLILKIQGKTTIDGALPHKVHADESTWTIVDNKVVQICLAKTDPNSSPAWKSLLVDQYQADPLVFDKMEQRLTLQKMEAQNSGFDFSNATISGNYHNGGPELST